MTHYWELLPPFVSTTYHGWPVAAGAHYGRGGGSGGNGGDDAALGLAGLRLSLGPCCLLHHQLYLV